MDSELMIDMVKLLRCKKIIEFILKLVISHEAGSIMDMTGKRGKSEGSVGKWRAGREKFYRSRGLYWDKSCCEKLVWLGSESDISISWLFRVE